MQDQWINWVLLSDIICISLLLYPALAPRLSLVPQHPQLIALLVKDKASPPDTDKITSGVSLADTFIQSFSPSVYNDNDDSIIIIIIYWGTEWLNGNKIYKNAINSHLSSSECDVFYKWLRLISKSHFFQTLQTKIQFKNFQFRCIIVIMNAFLFGSYDFYLQNVKSPSKDLWAYFLIIHNKSLLIYYTLTYPLTSQLCNVW